MATREDPSKPPAGTTKKRKVPQPNFRTPDDQLNTVEKFKLASNGVRGQLREHFRDHTSDDIIEESEQLAKSHGIYLEYNRAKTGKKKDWMYMIRLSIPGGGPLNREGWRILDEISTRYTANPQGAASLRITTRQNIQFHWVKKAHVIDVIRNIAQTGFFTLNGCGDNTRNVMACPLSAFSNMFDANALARKLGAYFQLPAEPHVEIFAIDPSHIRTPDEHYEYGPKLLNRKFKIAVSAVHFDESRNSWVPDNCVELRANEVGIAPIVENDTVNAFQMYIGGGQGEKNGKPTFAAMGQPFGVFSEKNLLTGLDAIVKVHEHWGDRQNRHWARMKYLVHAKGIAWYREQAKALGAEFEPPIADFDYGDRHLHYGWCRQPSNNLWAFGAYIENGRLIDGQNGRLKTMARHLMDHYDIRVMTTPNQDLLFTDIPGNARDSFTADMHHFGHGQRGGKPYSTLRVLSGACVGLHTCRLAYTESEHFESQLIDELEQRGYGEMAESIGITGCERQCFRPATKTIGLVGQGPDRYMLKLGGSQDARNLGTVLVEADRMYLRQIPRDQVANVCAALFNAYKHNRLSPDETMGAYHQRIGLQVIIDYLKENETTRDLMGKTHEAPYLPGTSN